MTGFRTLARLPVNLLIFLIELYRTYVSPTRMPVCRFTPSCSEYAVTALRTRGLIVGLGLTAVRLAKCAPWHPGGWDPVPAPKRNRTAAPVADAAASDPVGDQPAVDKPWNRSPHAVTGDTTDGST
ncbi:membrane protein insertion efficiency factor YidD [Nocardia sp. alder85J]|uniref:membrane protein insertion efficiency factor YidD n=1 Tax=Nocardia sp. alder85J TaxID=2862949 RepID=UPI001CD3623E|nr:membrane protein insertion efficiency factor YidD [Nocardia sp. alder85J]MCX4096523.1 membrane protein insertion efficiency factor YidD [Nocardia sp. alder85J]